MDPLILFLLSILIIAPILLLSRRRKPSNYFINGQPALTPKHKSSYLECPLIQKTTISHDTYSFKFTLPSKLHVLGIHVGEHIIVHEQIATREHPEGELVERKYTPTSLINQQGSFDLLIKIYRPDEHPRFPNGGKLTSWLDHIQVNQPIHITGPYGRLQYRGHGKFRINKDGKPSDMKFNRIVMIAGGSGITPMYQIIQSIVHDGSDRTELSLLFANKTESDILLYEELKSYMRLKKLNLSLTLDNPPDNWQFFTGFVNREMVEKAFGRVGRNTICLTCGPGPMNQLAMEHFKAIGATEETIHKF